MKYRIITSGRRFYPQKRTLLWWRFFSYGPDKVSFERRDLAVEFLSYRIAPMWEVVGTFLP